MAKRLRYQSIRAAASLVTRATGSDWPLSVSEIAGHRFHGFLVDFKGLGGSPHLVRQYPSSNGCRLLTELREISEKMEMATGLPALHRSEMVFVQESGPSAYQG
jgi:hypothetical protein